jgi:MerR family transcriptional regulator, copper efflux regulator
VGAAASQTTGTKLDMHQIGAVAERVGLSLRTVRYYEEMGLIRPVARTNGGFRLYTDDNIERLLTIKQMKPLGFSLDEMRELLEARDALRSLDSDDPRRLEPAAKLGEFARYAERRVRKMRGHLAAGEELVRALRRESRGTTPTSQDAGAAGR